MMMMMMIFYVCKHTHDTEVLPSVGHLDFLNKIKDNDDDDDGHDDSYELMITMMMMMNRIDDS